jgi:hypothetical protein
VKQTLRVIRYSGIGVFATGIMAVIQGCTEREGALALFLLFLLNFCSGPIAEPVNTGGGSTSGPLPTVTTDAPNTITNTTATLNGTVNANNTSTTVTFEYGETTAYGTTVTADQSPVTGAVDSSVSKAITGLGPGKTYHYRVVGQNTNGTANGGDLTFTTDSAAPTVTTNAASSVASTSATLNGTVNANGASATVTFEYGTTIGYGTTVTADQSPVSGTTNSAVSKSITGLAINTTYHFRVVGTNGQGTTNGADMMFTTSTAAPTVTTNSASSITDTTATINGTVNANGASTTVTFEYGTTTAYGTTVTADQSPVTGTTNTAVSKSITGLTASTTYHYRAVGVNGQGTTNGADMTFTTEAAPFTIDGYGLAMSFQLDCNTSNSGNSLQAPTDAVFNSRRVLAQAGSQTLGTGVVDIAIDSGSNLLTITETNANSCTMGNTRIVYPQSPPSGATIDLGSFSEVQYTSTLTAGGFSGAGCGFLVFSDGTNTARTALNTSTGAHTTTLSTGSVDMTQVTEVGVDFGNQGGAGFCAISASTDFSMTPLVLNP